MNIVLIRKEKNQIFFSFLLPFEKLLFTFAPT